MSDTIEELVARLGAAQKRLAALEARERPLVLRGWRDDFLGRAIHEQYSTVSNLGGSGTLCDPAHGGWYRLQTAAALNSYHQLRLGGGYDTLDADEGWTQICRFKVNTTIQMLAYFGAYDIGVGANIIELGCNSAVSANWFIRTRTGGGALNDAASTVAADTNWHIHRADVCPVTVTGGRRIDYYLDGSLIVSTTVSVPTAIIEPMLMVQALAAAIKRMDVDFWDVIPMNLV